MTASTASRAATASTALTGVTAATARPVRPVPPPRTCRSTRDATWLLVVRNSVRVTSLRASFEGVRARVTRTTVRGRRAYRVNIDLSGLQRGVYVGRVNYRIARTTGSTAGQFRNNTRVQYWRVCFGNPKDGLKEGLNRLTTTIISPVIRA